MAPWTALPLAGAVLILAGCAATPDDRAARCEAAAVTLATYKAARAGGDWQGGPTERAVEAAAETLVLLRCAPPAPPRVE